MEVCCNLAIERKFHFYETDSAICDWGWLSEDWEADCLHPTPKACRHSGCSSSSTRDGCEFGRGGRLFRTVRWMLQHKNHSEVCLWTMTPNFNILGPSFGTASNFPFFKLKFYMVEWNGGQIFSDLVIVHHLVMRPRSILILVCF